MSGASELLFDYAKEVKKRLVTPRVLPRNLNLFSGETPAFQQLDVTISRIIHTSARSTVYLGTTVIDSNDTPIVLKCVRKDLQGELLLEATHYAQLKELQNDVIPLCYGLYGDCTEGEGYPSAFLVLEYCGEPLEIGFCELPLPERYGISYFFVAPVN
jgi:hypothetical protein